MAYVNQLREIDTDSVIEITHAAFEINVLRDDRAPGKEEERAKIITALRDAFPESEEGYIRVPLVINKK